MSELPTAAEGESLAVASSDGVAKVFSALGHPIRLRIFKMLAAQEGCFCGELVHEFGMAQSTISHHLKILKEAGLIKGMEQGTWVCYCVDRDRLREIKQRIEQIL